MFKRLIPSLVSFAVIAGVYAWSSAPAFAESSWWNLTSSVTPTYFASGGSGQILLSMTNVGYADVDGMSTPVRILATLPAGLKAQSIKADVCAGQECAPEGQAPSPVLKCEPVTATLECTFTGTLRPYDAIEVRVGVQVLPSASSGEEMSASVSGGGAPSATLSRPITVSEAGEEAIPFGFQDNELALEGTAAAPGGAADTQAGSHPFQLTNTLVFNQFFQESAQGLILPAPVALPKDVDAKLPPGLIGNPTPLPRCTLAQFLTRVGVVADTCPTQSAVGVASVLVDEPGTLGVHRFIVPVFNLEPAFGEPARFGFYIALAEVPVLLDTSVRGGPGTGEEYAITVTSPNITEVTGLLSSQITFWGVPDSPVHNNSRGWQCLGRGGSCGTGDEQHPPGFLIMPTSCTGPLQSNVEADSWLEPRSVGQRASYQVAPMQALDGCNQLSFSPSMQAEPTTDSAASPSGLNFNLNFKDEGLTSADGTAESQLSKTVVMLPEGFTIDPSAGVGLAGCTPADYARETISSAPGAGCPNESKLGTVEIETPLLTQKIDGNIFIAQPYENPFSEPGHPNGSLVALYVVAKNPETGVMIKLAGRVEAGGQTGVEGLAPGQLRTTFENNPQLPFDHFNFHFREGVQAPLITPATCGTYPVQAALTPWSQPTTTLTDVSSFQITSGVGGGACPSGNVPPFNPGIEAGTVNNNAGAFSSLYIHLTRSDADAEIAGFSTNMPPGLTGYLTGLPFCPEADIEAARHKTGAEEEANPSCPAATQIGHTLVGTGVGAVLAYVPGKVYFAGPFDGAPFSIVSVTSAKVGPFDLVTVVLRFGLNIDPYTAQVNVDPTSSEPIPTILRGIVTHVRDIRVYIDRPNFIINPTNCTPLKIGSTLESNLGQHATVTSPFQNASCGNLAFSPKFAVSTSGKTSRENGASLSVKLTYPLGPVGTYANIARVKVELPKQLPSRLTTLQKACTAAQFKANPAGCPSDSIVGHAKASTPLLPVPLEGPAYFVSNGGESFPNLVMVLQGYGVTIDLVGDTFINEKTGITSSTFKAVPDQPVGSFELTLPEGKYSALAANGSLCKDKLKMPTEFVAQNGAEIHESTKIAVTGCPKAKRAKHKAKKRARRSKAKHSTRAGRRGRKG